MENIVKELTRSRLKIERDGKSIVDLPVIACLPGLLAAPRLSITGLAAAPLLGCNIRLESEDGRNTDLGKAVKEAAETAMEKANTAAKSVREEVEKAWQAMSDENQAETDDAAAPEDAAAEEDAAARDAAEEPEAQEGDDIPTIHAHPDDSEQA